MSKARELASLGNAYSDGALSNRNKIINGAMTIDQRNGGSALTVTSVQYGLDRFQCVTSISSAFSVQQVSDAPTGFSKSMKVTSNAATTVGASDYCFIQQLVEGYNIADFSFGTSGAKTITLSFWVKSSLTGDFGVTFYGPYNPRTYQTIYTINSADTWEYKTITIDGDTSGTWYSNHISGIQVIWVLGIGSSLTGSLGSWATNGNIGAAGATSLVATNGATLYITGVQLEVGDTATPFEHRSYGQELALCQRYFWKSVGGGVYTQHGGVGLCYGPAAGVPVRFPVDMRATPSFSSSGSLQLSNATSGFVATGVSLAGSQTSNQTAVLNVAASGLTTNSPYRLENAAVATSYLAFDAEL